MTTFMELVEQGEQLAELFQGYESSSEELFITIGSENKQDVASDYSIVASTYSYGGLKGTIAILGPKRMYYDRIAALVRVTADLISERSN